MPRKAEWTHRIGGAIARLETLGHDRIDRAALEQLLGLSPRQALRILSGFGAQQAGKSLSIDRLELIARFQAIASGETVKREAARLGRVHGELRLARQRDASRRIVLPAAKEPVNPGFASLPTGIRLAPGRLEITFQSGEELLARLLELLQAVNNDVDLFLAVTGPRE